MPFYLKKKLESNDGNDDYLADNENDSESEAEKEKNEEEKEKGEEKEMFELSL